MSECVCERQRECAPVSVCGSACRCVVRCREDQWGREHRARWMIGERMCGKISQDKEGVRNKQRETSTDSKETGGLKSEAESGRQFCSQCDGLKQSGFTLKGLSSKLITLLPPLSPSSLNLEAFLSVSYSISPSVHLYLFISLHDYILMSLPFIFLVCLSPSLCFNLHICSLP